ncbi:MAG: glycosyltransferase family 87 protein [Candidatus Sulfotelmatobacter sp.]
MSNSAVAWRSGGILGIVILCAACMIYYHLVLFVPRVSQVRTAEGFGNGYSFGADFYPIWLTAREGLLHHRDPYSPQTTRQVQIDLFGRTVDARVFGAPPDYWTFAYPAITDALLWPIGLLPFSQVRIGFGLFLGTLTALSVVLWVRIVHPRVGPLTVGVLVILTLSSYAVLEGLFAEQMGLLVGFLLAASLAALVRRRLFFSGSLLALALIKPQVMLLIGTYLLLWSLARWRTRWHFAGGFFLTSSLLGVSSLLIWPHWITEWVRVLSSYRRYSNPPLVSHLLGSQVFGNQISRLLGAILIVALLFSAATLSWRMRFAPSDSRDFRLTISLLLAVTTIAVVPGHAVYDDVVLLPGIILIASCWRDFAPSKPFRVTLAVAAFALFWQWICAPFAIALRPMVSQEFASTFLLTLPIRTAASIPFGVCALLGLMLWQGRKRKLTLTEKAPIVKPEPITS